MRIVMIGDQQIQVLLALYSRFARVSQDQSITYLDGDAELTADDREAVERAELLVEQVKYPRAEPDIGGISVSADRIGVPFVSCGFLWPFAGQPHPNNPTRPFRRSGPFNAESSDAYLNRLVQRNFTPDDALAAYLALDINEIVDLDRLLAVSLERQRTRDEMTGFQVAPVIEQCFRHEQVFRTPSHPDARISVVLAKQFFEKLGADSADIARMKRAVRMTPFPRQELPVHPSVARHFKIEWAPPDRKYQVRHDGPESFAQFVRRYVAGAWNEALDEGISLSWSGDPERAHELLTSGLRESAASAHGHWRSSCVLERLGQLDRAIEAAQRAVALEPDEAEYRLHLSHQLYTRGDAEDAERQTRVAAALAPFEPRYASILASRLNRDGAAEEAAAVARHGLLHAPNAADLHSELGRALTALQDIAAATENFRAAVALDPKNPAAHVELADALERAGQPDEAIRAMREAVSLRPDDPSSRVRLARLLQAAGSTDALAWLDVLEAGGPEPEPFRHLLQGVMKSGRLDDAATVARRAINRFPNVISFRRDLSTILEQQGSLEDALHQITLAATIDPDNGHLIMRCGDLLLRLGYIAAAESEFRAAIARLPGNSHGYSQLGSVLTTQQRYDEAIAARQEACRLEPANMHRRAQLGHSLIAAGKFGQAEHEIRAAIARAPNVASFHVDLCRALDRSGKLHEAIDALRPALTIEPRAPRIHALHGHLLMRANSHSDAEAAYREAIAHGLDDVQVLLQLSRLVTKRGNTAEARTIIERALRIDPGNKALADALRSLTPVATID